MAAALLKKGPDDEVRVETPRGIRHYVIVTISYRG
jgi:transcription elongation GreA/GreB family factor